MFKAMKFRVKDKQHSEQLQKVLFKLGYTWCLGGAATRFTGAPYLYAGPDGCVAYSDKDTETFFNAQGDHATTTLEQLTAMLPQEKPPIGLRPKWIAAEARAQEIVEAIQRYVESKKEIPLEWVDELNECLRVGHGAR